MLSGRESPTAAWIQDEFPNRCIRNKGAQGCVVVARECLMGGAMDHSQGKK